MELHDVAVVVVDIVRVLVVPAVIAYAILAAASGLDPFTRLLLYVLVLPVAISFYALAFLAD